MTRCELLMAALELDGRDIPRPLQEYYDNEVRGLPHTVNSPEAALTANGYELPTSDSLEQAAQP